MITIFDAGTRQELINRLNALAENNSPAWGKMNAAQMLRHCRLWEEMIHENKLYKRPVIGRLIGPLVLKQILKQPRLRPNTPTIPEMKISATDISFEEERQKLAGYAAYSVPDNSFIHPFFGKMSREQIGTIAYMHLDHHLRQFGI